MGSRRSLIALLVIVLVIALAGVALWQLPAAVSALPGRVRQYIPEPMSGLVAAPTPAALPTPNTSAVPRIVDIVSPPTPVVLPAATGTAVSTVAEAGPVTAPEATNPPATQAPTLTPEVTATAEPSVARFTRLEGVGFVGQKFNNCGPTNLSLVLDYHGSDFDQLDIAAQIRPEYEDRNVSPHELRDFVLANTDMEAAVFAGADLPMVKRLIAAGLPVIVEKGLLPDEATGWMGHYLTLVGFDDVTGVVFTRDTFHGPWEEDGRLSYDDLLADWKAFNNTIVVVYPTGQQGEVDQITRNWRTNPAAMWINAAESAQAAAAANDANPFDWFNLGTSLTQLAKLSDDQSQWQQAAAAYDQARLLTLPPRMLWYQFDPFEAYLAAGRPSDTLALAEATFSTQGGRSVEEVWLYQGLALRAQGDEAGARAAFSRVESLNPLSQTAERAREALQTDS